MIEDAAIRIDFDSAEFVHVTHTMEFFLRPTPRNLSHRILGTRPRRSGLEFSNETQLPRYLPTDSPTHCLGYPCGWVASLTPQPLLLGGLVNTAITRHLVATCPTRTPGYTLWISR